MFQHTQIRLLQILLKLIVVPAPLLHLLIKSHHFAFTIAGNSLFKINIQL
jgi:hypothetical protein